MENVIINTNDGLKKIDEIQFGVLSTTDISKLSVVELVNRGLYNENREGIAYGPLDLKMGVSEKGKTCTTCNKKIADCPGHFGHVRLDIPIFHIGYYKYIINILQCICKDCGKILLKGEHKEKYRKIFRRKKKSSNTEKLFKEIIDLCKKVKKCPDCNAFNGTVKHIHGVDATQIVHERYNQKINPEGLNILKEKYETASNFFKEMENSLGKVVEELTSQKVFNLFLKIPKDELIFFDMNLEHTKPIDLLVHYIIVPPLTIRPTVQIDHGSTNEDDLTIKIGEMIQLNKFIKLSIAEGNNPSKMLEDLSLLQHTHAQYINSNTKGLNKNILGNKPIRSLCSRLQGKHGRFRGNLSGKRADFTGRTVISPDPNLKIDQVGIPVLVAKTITYSQRVTNQNINELRKFVINGPDTHPGANFVELANGNKIYLAYTSRKKVAEELKVGDIVERHLMDDDIILFNRQPSLHRMSIMAFRAKVLPWRTFRFNECVCTPFNADFDGDEMNIHLPQTEEARSEALHLMGVNENLITPKNTDPLVAATQDFLTTFYLITQKDYFIDRAHFFKYLAYFNDANEKIEIPPPCILKPIELWSGKQLFSLLLRPNRRTRVIINLEMKARNFSKIYKKDEFRCPNDGYIYIKNSELLTGNIDKTSIGNSSKNGIVFALIKDNNKYICSQVLSRISKFSARWVGDYGVSLGISDVYPRSDLIENKNNLIDDSYTQCEKEIKLYETGQIALKAGLNAEESLESIINKILSDVRETIGSYLRKTLPKNNYALVMAVCGSKGSDINLSQMIACLGQQVVSGQRIGNGFINRTLPHFEPYSKYPAAKGFIRNSFYTGLNATEFFFHTIGGREGLIDTAVKTADTGYMQRRLMKALEDLTVQYDNSVTISSGEILQFIYGDDGVDPTNMDDSSVVNFNRLYNIIKSCYPKKSHEEILTPKEILEISEEEIEKRPNNIIIDHFILELRNFIQNLTKNIYNVRQNYSKYLNPDISFSEDGKVDTENFERFLNGFPSFTKTQLHEFFRILWIKYRKAMAQPGDPVGAIAAQSIGEPGTQMTLKTFHFAGVASMNITLGVPRIREIINFTKNISTPVIYAKLLQENDLIAAKIVKGRIEKTKLSEIIHYIKEVISSKGSYLKVKLNPNAIEFLKLEITINQIKDAILRSKKLKLKDKNVFIESNLKLRIEPPDTSRENLYFSMQIIKKRLGAVVVSGLDTVSRAVINKRDKKQGETIDSYVLAIEGTGLREIMRTPGIDHRHCLSNNIDEIEKVLGIEAARSTIINEIKFTMSSHSINVDIRHLQLVADLMTFKGGVLGFQRFGMVKMKDSVLLHSSFEKTNDILFDSAFHSKTDVVKGVSECIITGKMISLGTGICKVFYDPNKHNHNITKKIPAKEKINIIEEKLKSTIKNKSNADISNLFNFNLVDYIR